VINNRSTVSSRITRKTVVSASVQSLLATLMYFVYLRSEVDSRSSESDNESDCYSESTDSESRFTILWFMKEEEGIAYTMTVISTVAMNRFLKRESWQFGTNRVFCLVLSLRHSTLPVSLDFQCILTACSNSHVYRFERSFSGNRGRA